MIRYSAVLGAFLAGVLLTATFFPTSKSNADESSTCVVLYPGWNLITYAGSDAPVIEALGTVKDDISAIYYQNERLWYFPNASDWAIDLHELKYGEVYWIYSLEFTAWAMR